MKLTELPGMNQERLLFKNASTFDALQIIKQVAEISSKEPEIIALAQCLKNFDDQSEFVQNLSTFVLKAAYFEPDHAQHQKVKSSLRILRDGKTNCVGYTTLISSLLSALKIPHTLRIVDTGGGGFNHIYPILNDIPMDLVIQQDQSGKEHLTRAMNTAATIGVEVPYKRKFDLKINP